MYKVEVEYSPAYEFITSLYFYINKNRQKIYELGADWKRNVDEKLSPTFKKALKDKRMEVLHRINLLVHKCPHNTPELFIQWFESLSTTEIYDYMKPWVKSIPRDMFDLHEHLVYLFKEWDEHYFKYVDPSLLKSLELDAIEKKELAKKMHAVELVEMCTNGIRIESNRVKKILLVPQYHYSPTSIVDYYQEFITCLYPIELHYNSPFISKKVIHYFSSLSDQNRLLILQSLYVKERSFKELLGITSLSKSNLHYHLAMLRTSGIIRAHHSSERVEYYSLRLQTVLNMHEKILSYIRND
ncbi:winged helix-turn-helix domain-containing protein [Pseudogracilibacillus sp. SE30717A]|uniref:ArsR/SmtB family transcription factor n=1 Tax=Pseudogracilibacillus sp. SE30717A TaxID=3098293 RepID=UPI00300E2D2E